MSIVTLLITSLVTKSHDLHSNPKTLLMEPLWIPFKDPFKSPLKEPPSQAEVTAPVVAETKALPKQKMPEPRAQGWKPEELCIISLGFRV